MTHVGCETFLQGRQLQSLAQEFPQIPFSSLYDAQHKFLFYFGHFHRQSAPVLSEWFLRHGGSTWLIDATLEAGTPMYFGVYEAQDNLLLDAYRIPSENADALSPCLTQTADRLRQLKLQSRLKEQRNALTDWLRGHLEHPRLLAEVLLGKRAEMSAATAGREVVIAYHQWLLDYSHDGRRQGFPFDPYLLYFHRRVVRGSATVEQLLRDARVRDRAPQVLKNFASMLRRYLSDSEVIAAADQYEAAFSLFHRLRTTLRMAAQGDNPLRDRYRLDESDAAGVQQSLESFRLECRQRMEDETEEASRERYRIVCQHLDRYWNQLFALPEEPCREQTTNGLEGWWGTSKRRCRQRHGRKKLTREFRSLPAEFMLVGNLENPKYVELVLDGDLSKLPEKLAVAGRTAGPWTTWRSAQQPLNEGRLPMRLIRHNQFLEELTTVYDTHAERKVLKQQSTPIPARKRVALHAP